MNEDSFFCYLGVEDRIYVSKNERVEELKKVAKKKNFQYDIHEQKVNHYNAADLIALIENHINILKPLNVFIPHYSYNQDHRNVYDACITALRPHDKNWFVKRIFIYEQPHTFLWPYKEFIPNFYKKIDINDKIETYKLYASQVREHRSPEIITAIAKIRGKQANLNFAEAFQCVRFVLEEDF